MLGLVQKQAFRWPMLQSFLANQQINYVDFALTEHLLKNHPEASENVAAFICHLSISSRAGHLCVSIDDERIFPDPTETWTLMSESKTEEAWLDFSEIRLAIAKGVKELPEDLVYDGRDSKSLSIFPICRCEELYYLQRFWILEKRFLDGFISLLSDSLSLKINEDLLREKINDLQNQRHLLPEQAEAIFKGCQQNFTVICGGPGTGKTYTAGHLLKVFWDCLSDEERHNFKIVLAAPTGKAASNLLASIQKVFQKSDSAPDIRAQTMHSLLGISSSRIKKREVSTLSADLLIIDESSMIDVNIMSCLMRSLKPGSRLILLGDRHQLPPVEAGTLFSDLVFYLQSTDNLKAHLADLKKCLRTELQKIIELGSKINSGDLQRTFALLEDSRGGVSWRSFDAEKETKQVQSELLNYAFSLFPIVDYSQKDITQILNAFNQFRLLTPIRKGMLGVETLNLALLKRFQEYSQGDWLICPIIIVKNDYKLELFNGETGILVRRKTQMSEEDYALFPNRDFPQVDVRRFSAMMLPKFEYAYCLSVYKSQGSEFDHVLMVLPGSVANLNRELLYTGVTRARKRLEIWGSREAITRAVSQRSFRLSGFSGRRKASDI